MSRTPLTTRRGSRRAFGAAVILGVGSLLQTGASLPPWQSPAEVKPDVFYVPTPPAVVDAMLALAQVTDRDVVYDLGSGDGRIPIAAAVKRGARGVGIDIDPKRTEEARENAKLANVSGRVTFVTADLFNSDIGDATVVMLYLLPSLNERLIPKLKRELKPGTRIVSHAFAMGDQWPPERIVEVEGRRIYLWTIK
jgi:SAM-dependent methyltransferase